MNPWILALMIVLFTVVLLFYVVLSYIMMKGAATAYCAHLCRQGKRGCMDINGITCCIGVKKAGAINIDANCQPTT